VVKLEYESDVVVSELHERVIAHRRQLLIGDTHRAAVDAVESAECVQQRALPHA
jgi:hypothetical protein